MKKLNLDLETLAVDSFATGSDGTDAGTVHAHGLEDYDAPTYPAPSCGCTTGASYRAAFCPPPSTKTGCRLER